MSNLLVRLFGSLRLPTAELPPSSHGKTLLAYLLLHPRQPHSRPHLATLLAPEANEERARKTLRQALWEVRRCVPPKAISTSGDTITLHPEALPSDVAIFDEATADLPRTPHLHDETHAEAIRHALTLYTADLLPDLYDDWLIAPREQRRERYLLALERLAEWEKQHGRLPSALALTQQLATADPLRETAHRELMRLYVALQRPQAALQQYTLCQQILADELGLDPEPETQQLAQAILEPTPTAPYLPPPTTPPPAYALHSASHLPLIGRQSERQQLLHHLGHGGLLLLAGEAGMGKSRLVEAIAEDAAWRGHDVAWGHTAENIPTPPYHPLRQALTSLLTPLRQQQIAPLLDGAWPPHLAHILPNFGAELAPHSDQTRLHEAIAQLLLALGRIKPTLLILEDLHWSDPATLACLRDLAPRLRSAPVLLLATYREQAMRDEATLWHALQAIDEAGVRQRLALAPLTAAHTAELIQQGLGLAQPAPRFAQRLHAQAGGSPLLVLELLRALHDEGQLTRDEAGGWHTPYDDQTADYAELPIPPSNVALVQKRLAHLPTEAVQVAQWAAVLGREIDFAWLSAIAPLPAAPLVTTLTLLNQRQFLQETATSYRFTHDTIREAVYATLPEAERVAIHGRVAQLLAHDPRATAAQRAYHCQQAQLWAQAITHAEQAAQEAEALFDNQSALAHYAAVLHLRRTHLPDPAHEFGILLQRQRWLAWLGWHAQQEAELGQMAAVCPATPLAQAQLANAHAHLAAYGQSDWDTAVFHATHALTLAIAHQLPDEGVRGAQTLGHTQISQGDVPSACASYEQAWQFAQQLDPAAPTTGRLQVGALLNLVDAYQQLGRVAQIPAVRQVLDVLVAQLGDKHLQGLAMNSTAVAAYHAADYATSADLFAQAAQRMHEVGSVRVEGILWGNVGAARQALRQYAAALAAHQQAEAILSQVGDRQGVMFNLDNVTALYLSMGQWREACASGQRGLALAEALGQAEQVVWFLVHLAEGVLGQGDGATSAAYRQRAEALVERLTAGTQARVAAGHGRGHAAQGAWVASAEAWARAQELYEQAGELGVLATAVAWQAEAWGQAGDGARAADLAAQAIALHEAHPTEEGILVAWVGYRWAGMGDWLGRGFALIQTILADLPAEWHASFLACLPQKELHAAWQANQPRTERVLLPRLSAPTRGKLAAEQYTEVCWVVHDPADEQIPDPTHRRQTQLTRLLAQAHAQGARPTTADLATALGVSIATIKRLRREQGDR